MTQSLPDETPEVLDGPSLVPRWSLVPLWSWLGRPVVRVAEFDFTVRVRAGLSRYGVRVGLGRRTIWFTEQQMRHGPELTLGSFGG